MRIGEIIEIGEVEPRQVPAPVREPEPERRPAPTKPREREGVPAKVPA